MPGINSIKVYYFAIKYFSKKCTVKTMHVGFTPNYCEKTLKPSHDALWDIN